MGLMTFREDEEQKSGLNVRQDAENTLRKLRDTFKEISQPIPDKDAMIPKESPEPKRRPISQPAVPEKKKTTAKKTTSKAKKAETKEA